MTVITLEAVQRAIVESDLHWMEATFGGGAQQQQSIDQMPMPMLNGYCKKNQDGPLALALWTCAKHYPEARPFAVLRFLAQRVLRRPPSAPFCYVLFDALSTGGNHTVRRRYNKRALSAYEEDKYALLCLEALLCDTAAEPWWCRCHDNDDCAWPLFMIREFIARVRPLSYLLDRFVPRLRPEALAELLWGHTHRHDLPFAQNEMLVRRLMPAAKGALVGYYDPWGYGTTMLHLAALYQPRIMPELLPYLGAYTTARNLAGQTPLEVLQCNHGAFMGYEASDHFQSARDALLCAERAQHPAMRRATLLRARRHAKVCLLGMLPPELLGRIVRMAMHDDYSFARFHAPPLVKRTCTMGLFAQLSA